MRPFIRLSTRQKVGIARLFNRCIRVGRSILHRPMEGEFVRRGLNWKLDLNEGIDLAIYLLGAFERDLARCYCRLIVPGSIVLDIGANIGAHTLPLAQHVGPKGRVVAIEATMYAYTKLRHNLSLNPQLESRTKLVHALLAEKDDALPKAAIHSSWPLAGAEPTDPSLCGALRPVLGAKVCTLDTLVRELALESVDWVKLDVDGAELTVLQGARELIAKYKPGIFLELAPYCYDQNPGGFAELIGILTQAGYTFYKLPGQVQLLSNPATLTAREIPKNGSINVLAVNRSATVRSRSRG